MRKVLFRGFLDTVYLEKNKQKIRDLFVRGEREILLVVESKGGLVSPTISLIDELLQMQEEGLRVNVLIRDAKSMALVLALSFNGKKSMSKRACVEFHLGSLRLEASDFDHATGVISTSILASFWRYEILLQSLLDKYEISKSKKWMAKLYGSGWLTLTDEESLQLGLVDELV